MHKIYFVFLLCCCQVLVAQQGYRSPFDFKLLLAGNFGELRSNHYHSGLDLKTEGGVGKPVHAVEKGYVSRISISAWGYGNGLYLTHPDGTTTVYGHLQRFAPKIAEFARRQQYAKESFMIDVLVSPNQLPVEQGEVVAYSGNTGSSAGPHTHFEVRNTKTEELYDPLIYLKNYFTDTRAPEIRNILIVAERRGRIGPGIVEQALEAIGDLGIVLDTAPSPAALLALCRTHRLTVYDALYLDLALREGATLATRDAALARAATAEGIRVV